MTLPDWLTIARVVTAFILLILLQACACPPVPAWTAWLALTLFVAAALTDWLDGHLARKWKIESDFGRLFDPLADKLLIAVAFIGLLGAGLLPSGLSPLSLPANSSSREFASSQDKKAPFLPQKKSVNIKR